MSIPVRELKTDSKAEMPTPVGEMDKDGEVAVCECCETHEVVKLAMIRASGYELRNILPMWFKGLAAKKIISHTQSESEGNVTIIVTYQ